MPDKRDSDISSPAAKQTRVRKPRTAANAKSKAKSKPKAAAAKSAAQKTAKSRRTTAKAAASTSTPKPKVAKAAAKKAKPQSEKPVVIESIPASKLPVSPREPAAADAPSSAMFSAAPVPENRWRWAGAPIAATVAFMATLGALLLGYWTGHAVGTDAVGETAVTVASAAEKTTAQPALEPAVPAEEPDSKEGNIAEAASTIVAPETPEPMVTPEAIQPAEPAAGALAQGLHLQVSALSNQNAASALRERLEGQGYPVVVEAQVEDDLVRVYVGPIADGEDLDEWAAALRKEGLKPFPKRL